jgi:glycosyltransferase involved in cell wall biosynthesis
VGGAAPIRQRVAHHSEGYPHIDVFRYRFPEKYSEIRHGLYFTLGIGHTLRTFDRLSLPLWVRRVDPDVYHPTYYRVPRGISAEVVVTIHDMIPERFPKVGGIFNRYVRTVKRDALAKASHVIAVSENTKRDLVRMTDIGSGDVTVIPPAPNPYFRETEDVSVKLPAGVTDREYFLYVGRRGSYKNFLTLLRAYGKWSANDDIGLVAAGGRDEWSEAERTVIAEYGIRDRVHLVGTVSQEKLYTLYCDALAFVYPSKYAGFGFPPLEAMLCDTPVVVSNSASIPEVVGNAGYSVDPCDETTLSNGLLLMLG